MNNENQRLDCRGDFCPIPVVKAKLALEEMSPGEVLKVLADDPAAESDFSAWCEATGNPLLKSEKTEEGFVFLIRKVAAGRT